MAKNVDWIAIEAQYRAGSPSVNAIAKEFGVDEGTIRNRAKKHGWTRDAEGAKRQIVKSAMSGIPNGIPNSEVRKIIEDEAGQDIRDMQAGLDVARACIAKLGQMVEMVDAPRDVKVIVEANKAAIETIRRIRGLDEAIGAAAPYEDQLRELAGK